MNGGSFSSFELIRYSGIRHAVYLTNYCSSLASATLPVWLCVEERITPVCFQIQQIAQDFKENGSSENGDISVIAKYPYIAQQSDELSFARGEMISVHEKSSDGWWKGQSVIYQLYTVCTHKLTLLTTAACV